MGWRIGSIVAALPLLWACAATPPDVGAWDQGNAAFDRKDYAEASRLYRLAADQGDARAHYRLGLIYLKGQGVAQDEAAARGWIEQAAAAGQPEAKQWLGRRITASEEKGWLMSLNVDPAQRSPIKGEWAATDCAGTPLALPFAQPRQCERAAPIRAIVDNECQAKVYQAYGGDKALAFGVIFLYGGSAYGCAFDPLDDHPEEAVKEATPFVASFGKSFSPLKRMGPFGAMTFKVELPEGEMTCFAFKKAGHRVAAGEQRYRYIVQGHVCRRDGAGFDDADITRIVTSVWEK